jgi:DNA-binding LacI/PurR family transcriptional regulator
MTITLNDVAKKAGVSPKTVSRVVNGEKDVSEETRQQTLQVIDEMNYVPHIQAQRLASGKTRSIALHYPLLNPSLFSERLEMNFITGIGMGAAQENYYFTLFTGEMNPEELKRICRASIADGLILMQVRMNDWRVDVLKKLRFPFMLIGRCQNNEGLSFVDFDFENAVIDSYRYLIELGHKEIGFLTYPESWQQENLGPAIRADRGFQQAINQFNLKPIYRKCNLAVANGYNCTRELIEQNPDMTAFVVVHNTIAVGAINAVKSLGWQVPEDYSIIGIGLGTESDLIVPPLTAINWRGDQIGEQAAKILIHKLSNKDAAPEQILMPHQVEVRGSTNWFSKKHV